MLDQVLEFFEVTPDYDLDLMQPNQALNALSGRLFLAADDVLEKSRPDIVLVHGDTTTSSIMAWAAFHRKIPVGHVEAGLRTYNTQSPFPEELNRQITGRISTFHFAPTQTAADNLMSEHVSGDNVIVTGNTVIDALLWTVGKLNAGFHAESVDAMRARLDPDKRMILVTGHRRENFGGGFENICAALAALANDSSVEILFPVHLNPSVREPVKRILGGRRNIHLIEPLDYPAFVAAMMQSALIITDSGGVQEEAPSLGKPVLVMRDTTERPEALEAGTVKLVGTDVEVIVSEARRLLQDENAYREMSGAHNPYGDGMACGRIASFLKGTQW
jgi:UDP-N-acetylglucosamine 2-epimerase (non-hydrolysing)